MNHAIRCLVLSLLGLMLVGCANGPAASSAGADATRQTDLGPVPAGMSERQIDSIAAIAGPWKGRLYAGPLNGRAMQVTVNTDGSWTNSVDGGGKFYGTVTAAGGKIQARSKSTGQVYVWRLYEGKQDAKKRALVWLVEGSLQHVATTEFAGH